MALTSLEWVPSISEADLSMDDVGKTSAGPPSPPPPIVSIDDIYSAIDSALDQLYLESKELRGASTRARKRSRKVALNTRAAILEGILADLGPSAAQLLQHCSKKYREEKEASDNGVPF
jgi:hypothetical protein